MELLYQCQQRPAKSHPDWAYDAVIYELNVRQYSPQGSFEAVTSDLPRIKALGVDIIWLMPIFPIGVERRKGSLGSYYSISDYTAVNEEFGSFDDLQNLIKQAHILGLRVILDWVPNHTARDAKWVCEHPEWYEYDHEKGEIATPFDWDDTAKLDYSNHTMRAAMVDAMKYWLTETGVDGFRVDMAMLEPIDFWNAAVPELQKVRPDIFMLAEAEGPHFHEHAFDATYAWDMHHLMVRIARGGASANELRDRVKWEASQYQPTAMRMQFTSNHDENSWSDNEFVRLGSAAQQMAALSYILPGIPLIYNGQEVASCRKLEFFDKDLIEWNEPNDYTKLYTELSRLRHTNGAFRAAEKGGDLWTIDNSEPWRIFSVKRQLGEQIVIGLFNFSDSGADVTFDDPDFEGSYSQIGSNESANLFRGQNFYLPPHGFFVYYRS